jgi:hypothetical protein
MLPGNALNKSVTISYYYFLKKTGSKSGAEYDEEGETLSIHGGDYDDYRV